MKKPTIAFTSGCFDELHLGHLHLLKQMRHIADVVLVAVNSDDYIREVKSRKPLVSHHGRMNDLWQTELVDGVIPLFDNTPLKLVLGIQPDFIVVGDDYSEEQVVGGEEAKRWGGKVVLVKRLEGWSTREILNSHERAISI